MKKRLLFSFVVIVWIITLSFSGCSSGVSSPEPTDPKSAIITTHIDYDGLNLIDIVAADSGYLALASNEKNNLISIGNDLRIISQEEFQLSHPIAMACGGGHNWYIAANEETYKITVYQDNDVFFDTDEDPGWATAQALFAQDTLFSVINGKLYIGQNQIELPSSDLSQQCFFSSVLVIKEQIYAQLVQRKENGAADQWLCPIDKTTKTVSIPDKTFPFYIDHVSWDGKYCIILSGSKIYQTDGLTCVELCDLTLGGINVDDIKRLILCQEDTLLVLQSEGIRIVSLRENADVEQITLGVYLPDAEINQIVSSFNQSGSKYRVAIHEYSSREDLNHALLTDEIDIVSTLDEVLMKNYAAKGILCPISENTCNLVLSNIVEASLYQGTCYYLPLFVAPLASSIPTETVTKIVDAKGGIGLSDILGLVEADCLASFKCDTKTTVLSKIITINPDCWINWNDRTAQFLSDDFISILEFCDKYVLTDEEVAANQAGIQSSGKPLFDVLVPLQNLDYYSFRIRDDSITGRKGLFFFQLPLSNYSGIALQPSAFYAAVQGHNKDAGQEFIDYIFSNDFWVKKPSTPAEILSHRYPANNRHFRELLDMQLHLHDDTEEYEMIVEAKDGLSKLITQADHFAVAIQNDISDIIVEEAEAYFHGDISVDEAARRIQNRVETYLAERG